MEAGSADFKQMLDEKIKSITNRYKPLLEDLERRGKQMTDDFKKPDAIEAVIDIDFDVTWADVEFIFDLPSVTMRTTDISLDIPEVTSVQNTIIFHTPSVRMVPKKVGQYPEIHGWTIVWKDIITDVPEVFMEEQRVIFDLPSVTMKRQDWKLDIPEFRMEKTRWVIGFPQITVRKVSAETTRIQDMGKQLQAEGEDIAARMKAEIEAAISFGSVVGAQDATTIENQISQQFDSAIATLSQAIKELVAKGIDPIKVPTETGDVNLRKQLSDLIEQRAAAVAQAQAGATVPA